MTICRMEHFYFDLHECGKAVLVDDDGTDLDGLTAVRDFAMKSARDVMSRQVAAGHLCLGCAITVRDRAGSTVLALPFADAITLTLTEGC